MVKKRKHNSTKQQNIKGFKKNRAKATKINASTKYDTCDERITSFGGLLAMIKFLDIVNFKEMFDSTYIAPTRKPKLGHYNMVVGLLVLLFIGFNRIWHFIYIRLDAMLCGFFRLDILPAASTFWRYVDSLGINQAQSVLEIMAILRERSWSQNNIELLRIHVDIDTTVETIYGNQQGGRKGHNTKNRGKKGYRPILCFIEETREYLAGRLRKGDTMSGDETASFIKKIKSLLPGCVQQVVLRADGEFLSWEAVKEAKESGFEFIIANKSCNPPFDRSKWYRPKKRSKLEYNSCVYKPIGWEMPCRFVAMRIPKELTVTPGKAVQGLLFEDDRYTYRIFCTSFKGKAHKVISEYDKRADVENLVGEAKREGLDAIPSAKFKNNYAFFQIVMLAYNIWRYIKITAQSAHGKYQTDNTDIGPVGLQGIERNTIRIARLKLLYISAKVVSGSNTSKVRYSIHDSRTTGFLGLLKYLDKIRLKSKPWVEKNLWPYRFALNSI
jgi:hypothetical protein